MISVTMDDMKKAGEVAVAVVSVFIAVLKILSGDESPETEERESNR